MNLGFSKQLVNLWWQGKGGLTLREVVPRLRLLLQYEAAPNYLVLHVGGNDIGQYPFKIVRQRLLTVLVEIQTLLPDTILVWSMILPRLLWRNELSNKALEKCRIRLNSMAVNLIKGFGGKYIRYPELLSKNSGLYVDNVHLSHIGNDLLLYRLQQAIQTFMHDPSCIMSPPYGEFGPWLLDTSALYKQ